MLNQKYLGFCTFLGKYYAGSQSQKKLTDTALTKPTIQDAMQKTLALITKEKTPIRFSSRTDSGVNALNMAFSFCIKRPEEKGKLSIETLKKAFNFHLIKNEEKISVNEIKEVPFEFDISKNCLQKEYVYCAESNVNLEERNVYQREKLVWSIKEHLNLPLMEEASQVFVGTHNFTNFSRKNIRYTTPEDYVRTIDKVLFKMNEAVNVIGEKREDGVQSFQVYFFGRGFLTYQIRFMMGALYNVGRNKIKIEDLKEHLYNHQVIPTAKLRAPPEGLFLKDVKFNINFF